MQPRNQGAQVALAEFGMTKNASLLHDALGMAFGTPRLALKQLRKGTYFRPGGLGRQGWEYDSGKAVAMNYLLPGAMSALTLMNAPEGERGAAVGDAIGNFVGGNFAAPFGLVGGMVGGNLAGALGRAAGGAFDRPRPAYTPAQRYGAPRLETTNDVSGR